MHAELMRQLPVLDDSSQLEKLRCRLGEVGRLLRQARLAEADMKQVRRTAAAWAFLVCFTVSFRELTASRRYAGRLGSTAVGPLRHW